MGAKVVANFRPSFTSTQISVLILVVRNSVKENPSNTDLVEILKKLLQFEFKIQTGIVSPAFTANQKLSLEQTLGLESEPVTLDLKQAAYEKWLKYPELCSPIETNRAAEYRYLNDLMSPEEETEFELENS